LYCFPPGEQPELVRECTVGHASLRKSTVYAAVSPRGPVTASLPFPLRGVLPFPSPRTASPAPLAGCLHPDVPVIPPPIPAACPDARSEPSHPANRSPNLAPEWRSALHRWAAGADSGVDCADKPANPAPPDRREGSRALSNASRTSESFPCNPCACYEAKHTPAQRTVSSFRTGD